MRTPTYPPSVTEVIHRLEMAGHEAFVVGGALRDTLLGREVHDFDVTTSALPQQTAAVFSDLPVIETGIKHGTVTVLIDGQPIEITTFRIDGTYHDARHPDDVTFTSRVEGDLSRRDFTINAMAHNQKTGLVDLFGGREDLAAGIIRAVGDPATRFREDALRILRAYRFMAKLNFKIEPETLAATKACRAGLAHISAERVTAELCGLFEGQGAEAALACMTEMGIWEAIAPDFDIQNTKVGNINSLPYVFEIRFAYFLQNCADGGETLIKKLRLSNAEASRIRQLLALKNAFPTVLAEGTVRRFMAAARERWADVVSLLSADGYFEASAAERAAVIEAANRIAARGDALWLSHLAVDGRALIEVGIRGKSIGKALEFLLDRVLDDPSLNQKNTLMGLAKEYAASENQNQ